MPLGREAHFLLLSSPVKQKILHRVIHKYTILSDGVTLWIHRPLYPLVCCGLYVVESSIASFQTEIKNSKHLSKTVSTYTAGKQTYQFPPGRC